MLLAGCVVCVSPSSPIAGDTALPLVVAQRHVTGCHLQVVDVYVLKRPHMDHFMQHIGPKFEVVVFTASLSKYADPLLDLLDKSNVVRWRLFR